MQFKEAPKPVQTEFRAKLRAKDWLGALSVLTANDLTVVPSDAPELREAIRENPALLTTGTMVKGTRGKREVTADVLRCEKDEHGVVLADWLSDPLVVSDSYPHFSSSWKHEYQIRHHVAFGQIAQAINVLRDCGLSALRTDFDGELWRSHNVHRQFVITDGRSIAFKREPG